MEPGHRSIIKTLGYRYVWLGEAERAQALLGKIPEAAGEMDVYLWRAQQRTDRVQNARDMAQQLRPQASFDLWQLEH